MMISIWLRMRAHSSGRISYIITQPFVLVWAISRLDRTRDHCLMRIWIPSIKLWEMIEKANCQRANWPGIGSNCSWKMKLNQHLLRRKHRKAVIEVLWLFLMSSFLDKATRN
jgi:hypothetical protein